DEQAAAHADFAVYLPDRQLDSHLFQRFAPGEHVAFSTAIGSDRKSRLSRISASYFRSPTRRLSIVTDRTYASMISRFAAKSLVASTSARPSRIRAIMDTLALRCAS